MSWVGILKTNRQIVTPVTDINIKKVPKNKKEKNCKERWLDFVEDWTREIKRELMRAEFKGEFRVLRLQGRIASHHWATMSIYNLTFRIRYPDSMDDEYYCNLLKYGFAEWSLYAASTGPKRFNIYSYTPNWVLDERNTAAHYGNTVQIQMNWNDGMDNREMPLDKEGTFVAQFKEATESVCRKHGIPIK
jgi:hypothetical protein